MHKSEWHIKPWLFLFYSTSIPYSSSHRTRYYYDNAVTAFLSCVPDSSADRNSLYYTPSVMNKMWACWSFTESDLHPAHPSINTSASFDSQLGALYYYFHQVPVWYRYNNWWRYIHSRNHCIFLEQNHFFHHFSSRKSLKRPSSRLTQQLPREVIMLVQRSASARCVGRDIYTCR
jgi:hypothetical protein